MIASLSEHKRSRCVMVVAHRDMARRATYSPGFYMSVKTEARRLLCVT